MTTPHGIALGDAVLVSDFLSRRTPLDLAQCQRIVEEAILLIENLYVHLPLKRAMYAVDPVRRLKLLKIRVDQYLELEQHGKQGGNGLLGEQPTPADDLWFHREMSDTLTSVRDLHTIYVWPKPFDRAIAFVPFQIEEYIEDGERRFTVSNIVEKGLHWFEPPADFTRGVRVTSWNGIPIERAVDLAGERSAGNNPDSRLARGLARLSVRPLAKTLPPDEKSVTLTYVNDDDKPRSLEVEWRVLELPEGIDIPADGTPFQQSMGQGLDHETDLIRLLRREVYGPKRKRAMGRWSLRGRKRAVVDDISEFEKKCIRHKDRYYGYIRIRSFKVNNDLEFLKKFIKIVEGLPDNGLIIDVRDNPGGCILSGERLLQVLTPRTIQPETMQFINSPLSLQLCGLFPEYLRWAESIKRGIETGTTFSSSLRLSPLVLCNSTGQRYYGPVVLITNSLSYSTTDIFAAGFQDNRIGPVIGTDRSTGAGGANVITRSHLHERFEKVRDAARYLNNPLPRWPLGAELPEKADFHIALRRTLRVRERSGMELEDLGVIPDARYCMTKHDVLHHNGDLLAYAAGILSEMPSYDLREINCPKVHDSKMIAEIKTRGIEWVNVFADGRAIGSQRVVADGCHRIEMDLPFAEPPRRLVFRGYLEKGRKLQLVAARKLRFAGVCTNP